VGVNSFGNEVIVEAGLLGIVFVNIDLPKLATFSQVFPASQSLAASPVVNPDCSGPGGWGSNNSLRLAP